MSVTNLCSCALIKDHKMKQIIKNLYVLIHQKNIDLHMSMVMVTGMVHCLLKVQTVISQKLSHRKFTICFCRHLFVCPIK